MKVGSIKFKQLEKCDNCLKENSEMQYLEIGDIKIKLCWDCYRKLNKILLKDVLYKS